MVTLYQGCHAPRERVSWNARHHWWTSNELCHAPRERVSWNLFPAHTLRKSFVTLHVSVWVEIIWVFVNGCMGYVTLHVSVWVEIVVLQWYTFKTPSRSTWACELKSPVNSITFISLLVTLHVSVWVEIWNIFLFRVPFLSRSTWACELKSMLFNDGGYTTLSRSTWACELKFFVS